MSRTVCVLGGGAWGTAIATVLATNGYQVKLWCYEVVVAEEIKATRCNRQYLPGIELDKRIVTVLKLKEALSGVRWVFEATPVKFLRSVASTCKPFFSNDQVWVILSKGIENDTLLLPGHILDEVFDTTVNKATIGGPSFAQDLAQKRITAVTVAAHDQKVGKELQEMLANDYFRPYLSDDVLGVQLGGALKNVLTLGIGMLDGAGFTDNTKAFLFTAGLREMATCVQVLGGRERTLYEFSGVGDLVLTAMGHLSRNLQVGRRLGKGDRLENILNAVGFIPEGINTVKSAHQLIQKHRLDMPIFEGLYQVIFGDQTIHTLLQQLMSRPLEIES